MKNLGNQMVFVGFHGDDLRLHSAGFQGQIDYLCATDVDVVGGEDVRWKGSRHSVFFLLFWWFSLVIFVWSRKVFLLLFGYRRFCAPFRKLLKEALRSAPTFWNFQHCCRCVF